jgi:hypothetical protein
LRDELRRKNKQGDAAWRKRRKEQAAMEKELAKKRALGFRKHVAALAKRAELKRKQLAKAKLRRKQKEQSQYAAKATRAAATRVARLERLLIEARKSAAFYRKRKAAKRREARKES